MVQLSIFFKLFVLLLAVLSLCEFHSIIAHDLFLEKILVLYGMPTEGSHTGTLSC